MAVEGQRLMTKTQHYRKVTKPLLERKRRARMNLYLDELKELIVDTMETQGEHVSKLEKADILEMTVTYLKARQQHRALSVAASSLNMENFRAGYTQAAFEVSKVFATLPGLDLKLGARLMKQLAHQLKDVRPAIERHNAVRLDDTESAGGDNIRCGAHREKSQQPAEQGPSGDVWRPW